MTVDRQGTNRYLATVPASNAQNLQAEHDVQHLRDGATSGSDVEDWQNVASDLDHSEERDGSIAESQSSQAAFDRNIHVL